MRAKKKELITMEIAINFGKENKRKKKLNPAHGEH